MLHQQTHPQPVDGCAPCRWATVAISANATPTRRRFAKETIDREARWEKDHDAYRRMWRDGLSPKVLDGAAELERRAKNEADVELGLGASEMFDVA